jgi:uncharacterized membrane protein YhdT
LGAKISSYNLIIVNPARRFVVALALAFVVLSLALPLLIYALFSPHVPGDFTVPKYFQAAATLLPLMLANLFQTVPLFPLAIILPRTNWYGRLDRKRKVAGWTIFALASIAIFSILGLRQGDGPLALVAGVAVVGLGLWVTSGFDRLLRPKSTKD